MIVTWRSLSTTEVVESTRRISRRSTVITRTRVGSRRPVVEASEASVAEELRPQPATSKAAAAARGIVGVRMTSILGRRAFQPERVRAGECPRRRVGVSARFPHEALRVLA